MLPLSIWVYHTDRFVDHFLQLIVFSLLCKDYWDRITHNESLLVLYFKGHLKLPDWGHTTCIYILLIIFRLYRRNHLLPLAPITLLFATEFNVLSEANTTRSPLIIYYYIININVFNHR